MVSQPTQSLRFMSPQHVLSQVGLSFGMQVADFGSGAGDFALAAVRIVGPDGLVHAIDIQDSAISSVRSKTRLEGIRNINPVKANLEVYGSSGLSDDSQDAVLSRGSICNDLLKHSMASS